MNGIQVGVYTYGFKLLHTKTEQLETDMEEQYRLLSSDIAAAGRPMRVTVAGKDWIEEHIGAVSEIHFGDRQIDSFTGVYTGIEPGRMDIVDITANDTTLRKTMEGEPMVRVVRGGVIPFPKLMRYIAKNRESIEIFEDQLIEGEPYTLLELKVPVRDASVLVSGCGQILKGDFMRLRIYVDASKGYVVRRMDYWTQDATLWCVRHDSRDFFEVSPGIWCPRCYAYISDGTPQKEGVDVKMYVLESVTNVNEPLPDSVFNRPIAEGTTITDQTDQRFPTSFKVGETKQLSEVYGEISRRRAEQAIQASIEEEEQQQGHAVAVVDGGGSSGMALRLFCVAIGCILIFVSVVWKARRAHD